MRRREKVRVAPYEKRRKRDRQRDEELGTLLRTGLHTDDIDRRTLLSNVHRTLVLSEEYAKAMQQQEAWETWKEDLGPLRLKQLRSIIQKGDDVARVRVEDTEAEYLAAVADSERYARDTKEKGINADRIVDEHTGGFENIMDKWGADWRLP